MQFTGCNSNSHLDINTVDEMIVMLCYSPHGQAAE